MYPLECSIEHADTIASQFLHWAHYFNREPLNGMEIPFIDSYHLFNLLLDYTPSQYRDHIEPEYYRVHCLNCGHSHPSGVVRIPLTSACYHCVVGENLHITMSMSYRPMNPMTLHFHQLPVVVQDRIFYLLVDGETHSRYNSYTIGENNV